MRALLQRTTSAQVTVAGKPVATTGPGLLILLCAMAGDTAAQSVALAAKTAKLRMFADDAGKMNRSVLDVAGECLVVSQFTLAADTRKGNRPSYLAAADPDDAVELCNLFTASLEEQGLLVRTGIFGADMQVELVNDGPVTIWLDSET